MTLKTKGTWGGARAGAGRPKTSPFVSHLARPRMENLRCPVKITLRLRAGLPSLRSDPLFLAFEKASLRARRFGLRIIEYSVQPKAIHLLCEFKENEDLERSLKSLNTTLAIAVKKEVKAEHGTEHKGPVFLGRYKLETLRHGREVRATLREFFFGDPGTPSAAAIRAAREDAFTSAPLFTRLRELSYDGLAVGEKSKAKAPSGKSTPTSESGTGEPDGKVVSRIRAVTASAQFPLTKSGWLKT